MLNITTTGSSPATECDRCDAEYKKENGCSLGRTSTEIMACRVEHSSWRQKVMDRFMRRM